MNHVPCAIHGRSRAFGKRDPMTRFVHAEKRGNGISAHGQHRFVASNEVEAVFVGRAAGLWHRVFVPVAASRPQFMHAQRAVGGQTGQQKRAVGEGGQLKFAVHIGVVGDVVSAQRAAIVNPYLEVGSGPVRGDQTNRQGIVGKNDGWVLCRYRLAFIAEGGQRPTCTTNGQFKLAGWVVSVDQMRGVLAVNGHLNG